MIRLFTKKKVKIAGRRFEPQPLTLIGALELCLLLAPYIPEDEQIDVLALFGSMKPQDITQAFLLLLDLPVEQLGQARPQELIAALPFLSEINDFGLLFSIARDYGQSN